MPLEFTPRVTNATNARDLPHSAPRESIVLAGDPPEPDPPEEILAQAGRIKMLGAKGKRRDSGRSLVHLVSRIFNTPLMIRPDKGDIILNALAPRLGLAAEAIPVVAAIDDPTDDELGYSVQNCIACIPIHGTLVKRASGMDAMSGMTSYEQLTAQIMGAIEDPDVKGLLFDVDSPGGESSGMFDLCDLIHSLRGTKPMYSVSNDSMYSAAYALGSCADQVYITREGGAGSIGCYMLHVDQSGMDKQRGLKFDYIFAGDRKVDGNPHEPLDKDARAELQAEVNRQRDMFVTLVARNRNCTAQSIIDLQAGCLYAQAAIPLLADKLGGMAAAMTDMMAKLGISEDDGDEGDDQCDPDDPDCPDPDDLFGRANKPLVLSFPIREKIAATAIPAHKTATTDAAWDGPANEARLKNDQTASYYRKFYAWQETGSDGSKKSDFKFGHHAVSEGGDIGAANTNACRAIIANLNGARSAPKIPSADRKGVWNHAAKHLRDAGLEPAPLKGAAEAFLGQYAGAPDVGYSIHELFKVVSARQGAEWLDIRMLDEPEDTGEPVLALRCRGVKASASNGSSRRITCCVAPYNQLSADLGGFKEIYQSGCFKNSLAAGDDARVLFNHDSSMVLGRRSAGTARFYEQPDGLYFEVDAPATSFADDLLEMMRRGDITGGSSAFFILKPRWEYRNGEKVRVIEEARLVEGSVASFPIYEQTAATVAPAALAATMPEPSGISLNEVDGARLALLRLR